MKKLLLILLLQYICFGNIFSQTISGKVISNSTQKPLDATNIRVTTVDNVFIGGTVTDLNGDFSVSISQDTFVVQISSLGYVQQTLTIKREHDKNVNIGTIALDDDTKVLGEVEVKADAVINTSNKTLLYPTPLQIKSSSSGFSLLKNMNLEGLLININTRSVKSSLASTIIYKINDVPSSLEQVIAIQPKQVQRIEYSSTASARYANEDAAVINIILKDIDSGTFLSNDFTAAPTTGFINESASVQTMFGKSKITIDYSLNWRSYDDVHGVIDQEYRYPSDTLFRHLTYDDAPFHYTNHFINTGYVYNDKKNTFSAKVNMEILKSRKSSKYNIYENHSSDIDILEKTSQKDNYVLPSLDLYYKRDFSEDRSLEFNLVGSLTNTTFDRELSDDHIKVANKIDYVYQNTDGRKQSIIFEGYYSDKIDKVYFSAGVRGMYAHTKNTYIYDNIAKLNQTDVYPYVEIQSKIGDLSYTVSTGLKVLAMDNYTDTKSYYRNLSTFSLFYKKNSTWNLRYNFRYTPQYPSLGQMSNVMQREDSIIINRGNPNIKPSQTVFNRLQFNGNYKKLTAYANVYAQKTFDFIESDIIYDPTIKSMISQSDNYPYMSSYGTQAQVVLNSLFDIFSFVGSVSWNEYKSRINGQHYSFNQWVWYVEANANYKDFTLYGGYQSPLKSLYGQTISLNENYSQLGLAYQLKNLTFNVGMMWAFTSGSKYGSENMSKVAPSSSIRYIRDNKSMVTLGFRYNVNWGKSIFKVNKNIQNSDDRDRGIL